VASVLKVENLVAGYQSGSRVLDGISLDIAAGEVVALIGRNGMGKTTFLRTIAGQIRATAGRVTLSGRNITRLAAYRIAAAGVGYVPQGREIFADFTVEQNLLMGLLGKRDLPNVVPAWAYEVFPILGERRRQKGGTLSGGQQQQLAIMRALVGRPTFLLLDEPSEGIQPSIVQEIGRTLAGFARDHGLTILLVEQNVELVWRMAERCLFIENGRIVDEVSDIEKLKSNPMLIRQYLSV
jgi:urea ABC transporter ATP-binding protein UrtE